MQEVTDRVARRSLPWWTWILPILICHLGTQISLLTQIKPGISASYLPIPLALALILWWGPRVLFGLYFNAVCCAGWWGLPQYTLWPLYALPETFAVGLGWLFFVKLGKGKCWCPDLAHTIKFVLLAILPASFINGFYVARQLVLLGDLSWDEFWPSSLAGFIATAQDCLSITVPMIFFCTPWLERKGLSLTSGAQVVSLRQRWPQQKRIWLECVLVFSTILLLSQWHSIDQNWPLYGFFVLWAALRHGMFITLAAIMFLEVVTLILPAIMLGADFQHHIMSVQEHQLALIVLSLAGLFVSRTIADQKAEIEQRRCAQLALKDSEERLKMALEAARMGTWSWDLPTDRVVWSAQTESIFDLEPGVKSRDFDEYRRSIHIEDRDWVVAKIQAAVEGTERSYYVAHRIVRPNGIVRWIEAWGEIRRNSTGQATMLLGLVVDATAQYRMQFALRHIVEKTNLTGRPYFDALVQALAQALQLKHVVFAQLEQPARTSAHIVAWWAEDRLQAAKVYTLAGTPSQRVAAGETLLYQNGVTLHYPQDPVFVEHRIESYIGVPVYDSYRNVIAILCAFSDTPLETEIEAETLLQIFGARAGAELERLQTYEALRNSEARLSAILENTPNVAIQLWNLEGCVQLWNNASERLYGFTQAEALGQSAERLMLDAVAAQKFRASLSRIADTDAPSGPNEIEFKRKDGSKGRCISSTFLVSPKGQEALFACVDVDVTELRKMERALLHAQKMDSIGRLAGGVAHDFNNLLTGIMGYCDLYLSDLTPHPRRRYIEEVRKIGVRASHLTRQLLSFSRQQAMQPRQLDLNQVVGEMRQMLGRLIEDDIELLFELSATPVGLVADPGQLEQVLMNLVVNARDAMPTHGRIVVKTGLETRLETYAQRGFEAPAGVYATMQVSDTGTGMSPETIERIFEPYFTTKEVGKGTGLGLATVYGIVKKFGGFVEVQSTPGSGSTFSIYLPSTQEPPQKDVEQKDQPTLFGHETILLVDDEETILEVASSGLRAHGYRVLKSSNPLDALKLVHTTIGTIHLLITDVVMPGMSGAELAAEVLKRCPHISILYTSGYTEDRTILHGVSQRSINFLEKPYDMQQLTEKVRSILSESMGDAPRPIASKV